MKLALLQLCSGDDPAANRATVTALIAEAAAHGAKFVATPEVTNCVSQSRSHQNEVLRTEAEDETLPALREAAREAGVWLSIGSLALKSGDPDGRFANRSFLIGPDGGIRARYDKIHMFDVNVTETETFRESDGYRPGSEAVVAQTPIGTFGLTICYDLRFPALHRTLAQAGAQILTGPAAFSPVTGAAHWEPLLRARAIETGCYVIAAAQTGAHPVTKGKPRHTYGHSMVVAPWGEVVAQAGAEPGILYADIDLDSVEKARARVPSLRHDREFTLRRE